MALITTKMGDKGTTTGPQGQVVSKSSIIINTFGYIDELNCALGLSGQRFDDIQTFLCELMGYLYFKKANEETLNQKISQMEYYITSNNSNIPPYFINPKGYSSMARAVCRRVEREIVLLHEENYMELASIMKYFNRLSDYLFIQGFVVNDNETSSSNFVVTSNENEIKKVA